MVVERSGAFLPSKLLDELRAAGVDCLGVTCTETGDPPVVASVQIIIDADAVDDAAIDAVCGSHDPSSPPVADEPTAGDLILGAIGKLDPATATASDVIGAIQTALDASGAIAADPAVQTATGTSGASANL